MVCCAAMEKLKKQQTENCVPNEIFLAGRWGIKKSRAEKVLIKILSASSSKFWFNTTIILWECAARFSSRHKLFKYARVKWYVKQCLARPRCEGSFHLLVELPVPLLWDRLGSLPSSVSLSLSLFCFHLHLVLPNPLHRGAFLSSLTPRLVPRREEVGKTRPPRDCRGRGTWNKKGVCKRSVEKIGRKSVESLQGGVMSPYGHMWSLKDWHVHRCLPHICTGCHHGKASCNPPRMHPLQVVGLSGPGEQGWGRTQKHICSGCTTSLQVVSKLKQLLKKIKKTLESTATEIHTGVSLRDKMWESTFPVRSALGKKKKKGVPAFPTTPASEHPHPTCALPLISPPDFHPGKQRQRCLYCGMKYSWQR